MAQPNAMRVALAAAERLPLKQQRQLAVRLLASGGGKGSTVTVRLRRLPRDKQSRLAELMDKNSEGTLTVSERAELKELGNEVDEAMLSNSLAVARAGRPELFDAKGRLVRRRFQQATSKRSRRENARK